MKFIADSMLGKLARWLRILGYDTIFDQSLPFEKLIEMSKSNDIIFLSKRKCLPNGCTIPNMVYIPYDKFEDQLRFIIEKFNLNEKNYMFTRCLNCNIEVVQIEKTKVSGKVPDRSFKGFDLFYQCPSCKKIYWNGRHISNTIQKLNNILHNQRS